MYLKLSSGWLSDSDRVHMESRGGASGDPLLPAPPERAQAASGSGMWDAVLSLTKTCVGTGVLALPWGFERGGALAVPGIVALGVWNWYTAWQLLSAREATPKEGLIGARSAYSAIVHASLGRGCVLLLEGSLCTVLIGVCASLQINATELLAHASGWGYQPCLLATAVFLVPFARLRSLRRLAFVSATGLGMLAAGLVAVAAYGLASLPEWPPTASPSMMQLPSAEGLADYVGIASFSFGVQAVLLPVQDGMAQPHRCAEALGWALALVTATYSVVGAGLAALYWRAPDGGVRQIILLNLPAGAATALHLSSSLVALLSYPLPLFPVIGLLSAAVGAAWHPGAAELPAPTADALRMTVLAVTTLLAMMLRRFGIAASIIGCLGIVFCQLLPPLCHLRLCAWPPRPTAHDRAMGGNVSELAPPPHAHAAASDQGSPAAPAQRARRVRPLLAAVDVALVALALVAFGYFTSLAIAGALTEG